jgi:hypothetical protein
MELGAALTGNNPNVDDRRDEPWPTATLPDAPAHLPQSPNRRFLVEQLVDIMHALKPETIQVPPATALGIQAGINDIGTMNKNEAAAFMKGK